MYSKQTESETYKLGRHPHLPHSSEGGHHESDIARQSHRRDGHVHITAWVGGERPGNNNIATL